MLDYDRPRPPDMGGIALCIANFISETAMGPWNSLKDRVYKEGHRVYLWHHEEPLHDSPSPDDLQSSDIGQEEVHWIEQDNRQPDCEDKATAGQNARATADKDYSYLGSPFSPVGQPTVEDEHRHHGLKDALLEHYTCLRQSRQLKWLKTARCIREDSEQSEGSEETVVLV